MSDDRYRLHKGDDAAVHAKSATDATRALHLAEVRRTILREFRGQAGMISTADVFAVGLMEKSSRGLLQSCHMAEQHNRNTELNHAELAMRRALEKVQLQCLASEHKMQEARTDMQRQKCIILSLQHQLHAKKHLLNTTKRADHKSAMYALHQNAAWTEQKMKKNAEHAKLWRLRDHTWTLKKRVTDDRMARERHVGQGTQELARLQTLVAASRTQLAALQNRITTEREAVLQICSTQSSQADNRFGIFASADGLAAGLDELSVDIQSIHSMDAEARQFALAHLSDRFDQLRSLSQHMRKVVRTAACVYDTLDLSNTLDAITAAASDLLDAAQARVLLLDADETCLWCPQPDASGDEESETHTRFPCSPCITMAALNARQLLAVVDPASHREYEETLDAASGSCLQRNCATVEWHPGSVILIGTASFGRPQPCGGDTAVPHIGLCLGVCRDCPTRTAGLSNHAPSYARAPGRGTTVLQQALPRCSFHRC